MLKSTLENICNLIVSLGFTTPSRAQMNIDSHDCLVANLKPYTNSSFVSSHTIAASFDLI
jgi:hypothetical protein